MGLTKLQTLLLPPAEGFAIEETPPEAAPAPAVVANGNTQQSATAKPEPKPALAVPATKTVEVSLPPPQLTTPKPTIEVKPEPKPTPAAIEPKPALPSAKRAETFLAGPTGEERPDYSYRFNSDGTVRETVVYYYGDDLRAAQASAFDPLRREAVYQGRVDAGRLFAARKLSDTLHVGETGHERRDLRRDYRPDGSTAQMLIFYYEGDRRAADAPSGAPVRRQVALDGESVCGLLSDQ
jgi:hypothetical protein